MIKLRHKITYINDPEIQLRRFNRALGKAMRVAGNRALKRYVPARFSAVGSKDLGYKDRSRGYRSRKRARKGHDNPYVYSGEMKRRALAGRKVRTSPKKITITVPITAEDRRNLRSKGYDVKRDMSSVSPRELKSVAAIVAERLPIELTKSKETRRERA